jgi:RNA polymerase sigma factor (sigma-70 family)
MNLNPESEKFRHLLDGCLNQDRKSQELLYKQYFGFAMNICLRYSKTRDEALEILNDAFLKVFLKIRTYDYTRPFSVWLKRIVVNTAIDTYRSQSKHYNHLDIETVHTIPSEEVNPLQKINFEDLLQLTKRLPKNYQLNFNLYIIEGYSHEEIAKMMNISVGTSKSNLSRAREMMRTFLKNIDTHKIQEK